MPNQSSLSSLTRSISFFLPLLLLISGGSPAEASFAIARTYSSNHPNAYWSGKGRRHNGHPTKKTLSAPLIRSNKEELIRYAHNDKGGEPIEPLAPIDQFRSLMGTLYGVAGLAHAADCYLGPSQLLVAAGSPPTQELPFEGQILVGIWCLSGPVAFVASRIGGAVADAGLVLYGAVEVAGAALLVQSLLLGEGGGVPPEIDALTNAVGVQTIVLASWLYSKNKQEDLS